MLYVVVMWLPWQSYPPLLGNHNMHHHVPSLSVEWQVELAFLRHPANDIYLGSNPLLAD